MCSAFNADFDGDQMAVHLPLSVVEAQAEGSHPDALCQQHPQAFRRPPGHRPAGRRWPVPLDHRARERGRRRPVLHVCCRGTDGSATPEIHLNAPIHIRWKADEIVTPRGWVAPEGYEEGDDVVLKTTLGTALFNDTLPTTFPFVNEPVGKKVLGNIVNGSPSAIRRSSAAASLDALKETGFYWGGRSGVTIAVSDVIAPANKAQILEGGRAARARRSSGTSRKATFATRIAAATWLRCGLSH